MCTVSIIALASAVSDRLGAFRVVCNRDENRTRAPAAPPRWRSIGRGPARAIWPMDLEAGGTWIAANEHGLCLCLLNLNPDPPIALPKSLKSRGLIIPGLIGSHSVGQVVDRLSDHPLPRFAPFRLVAVASTDEGIHIAEARWDLESLEIRHADNPPACYVSSGLGDGRAAPRLALFEELVVEPGATPERQDEFHRHTWPDRPEVSVMMSRAAARTVSLTTVEVTPGPEGPSVAMDYHPVPDRGAVAAGELAWPVVR